MIMAEKPLRLWVLVSENNPIDIDVECGKSLSALRAMIWEKYTEDFVARGAPAKTFLELWKVPNVIFVYRSSLTLNF